MDETHFHSIFKMWKCFKCNQIDVHCWSILEESYCEMWGLYSFICLLHGLRSKVITLLYMTNNGETYLCYTFPDWIKFWLNLWSEKKKNYTYIQVCTINFKSSYTINKCWSKFQMISSVLHNFEFKQHAACKRNLMFQTKW